VILTKADLCPDVDGALAAVREIAPATPVHAISVPAGQGLELFDTYCRPGRTVVFLGPSGVGKTTLLNALEGGDRPTAAIREDGRGRHTTTHRELVVVPGRGMVLDTPGMRELQLWDADAGLSAVFSDIEALALACRFGDCSHEAEPGCAVRSAMETGTLTAERYASYRKLEREERFITQKRDALARSEEKRRYKIFARSLRRTGGRGLDQRDER
jgi:ribosome biogenesis GTPase